MNAANAKKLESAPESWAVFCEWNSPRGSVVTPVGQFEHCLSSVRGPSQGFPAQADGRSLDPQYFHGLRFERHSPPSLDDRETTSGGHRFLLQNVTDPKEIPRAGG